MIRFINLFFFLIVIVAGLSFAVINAEQVQLNYYFGSRSAPLSLTLVVTLALGAVLGVLASLGVIVRLRRQVARLRKQVGLREKELSNLRAIPIKDER